MRKTFSIFLISLFAFGGAPASAQAPPQLEEMQGKYQSALQNIARNYEEQIQDLNRKYLVALQMLRRQLEARGDEEGLKKVDSEIAWVRESRDQIPHPWELLDAASEGTAQEGEVGPGAGQGGGKAVVLGPFWNRNTRTGVTAQRELREIFDDYAEPEINLEGAPGLTICTGVTYLMPVEEAIQVLGAAREGSGREPVETPGFPDRSFYYHPCRGDFEGGFDTALIVSDADNQVVAVQFSREARADDRSSYHRFTWDELKIHDLILNRRRASTDWSVGHRVALHIESYRGEAVRFEIKPSTMGGGCRRIAADGALTDMDISTVLKAVAAAPTAVVQIDTITADGNPMYGTTRFHDRSRLYLPRRIVSLILERVGD